VWDVDRGAPLATLAGLPGLAGLRPTLGVRRYGAEPRQVEVAIAWGDGQLRVWDVAREPARALALPDGRWNAALDRLVPGGLLTASYESGEGRVTSWLRQADGSLRPSPAVRIPREADRAPIPQAMAVLPGAGDEPGLAAILVAQAPGRGAAGSPGLAYE